ncbi:rho GTPase-activating protein 17-like isoform X6 [Saccostrea cucullata]|uniref:rho GTPase-activating protein 17-like isoform X6 n=1 Tax=Saccostrea cuccullata TaxID=36930 RepID=UPI002ED6B0B4
MLKKENLRKNFLRVKQIADQNLGRAEKSEVLSEDLQTVEKRVELVKSVCQSTAKKISGCLQGQGTDFEKRLKKLPENALGLGMIESSGLLGTDSVMGTMFQTCGECQTTLAKELLQYEIDVEQKVLSPIQEILDEEIPVINKCKKQLSKLTLDMDSCKGRWNQAVKQSQVHGTNMVTASAKADQLKEEYEESCNKMYQARDNLATEMFNFVAKEAEHSSKLISLLEAQRAYHKRALEALDQAIPKLNEALECNPLKKVYGVPLEEHLRVTGRDIALVLEVCVITLIDGGLEEEGLFRIAGMASKVKKLKNAFDANVIDMEEYAIDLHTVAGALKQYFRELPEPLLTTQLYPDFIQAAKLPQEQKLQQLWAAIRKLPEQNYNNFRYLIKFLAKLAEKSDENKMTPSNIAIVIGPNLLWSEGDNGPNMVTSGTISNMIELFITHCNWFFPEDAAHPFTFYQTFTPLPCPSPKRRFSVPRRSLSSSSSSSTVDFYHTTRGTAPPKSPGVKESHTPVTATVLPIVQGPQHGSVSQACEMACMTAVGAISSHVTSASVTEVFSEDQKMPSQRSSDEDNASSSEEVDFGTMASLKMNNSDLTDLDQSLTNQETAESTNDVPTSPPNQTQVEHRIINDSEYAEVSKVQKRVPRKPAPPPPERPSLPERPYSIAVTAQARPPVPQAQTWPRQMEASPGETVPNQEQSKPKTQPDKPAPPEKPLGGHPPQRSATMHERHSHSDRPSVPPPDRPKVPPPAVPNHQRSASTGTPGQFGPAISSFPDNDQVFTTIQEQTSSACLNKTGTL